MSLAPYIVPSRYTSDCALPNSAPGAPSVCPIDCSSAAVSGLMPGSRYSSSGSHWWWMRDCALASAMFRSNTSVFRMICSTTVMMRAPPGAPVARKGLPSFSTMVGVIDDSGRLREPTAFASSPISPNTFGTPGFTEKSSISLLRKKPAPGTMMPLPKEKFSV